MTTGLALTILLAFIVLAVVVAGLAIGLLLTGKSRLRRGCGRAPTEKKGNCPLCKNRDQCADDPIDKENE